VKQHPNQQARKTLQVQPSCDSTAHGGQKHFKQQLGSLLFSTTIPPPPPPPLLLLLLLLLFMMIGAAAAAGAAAAVLARIS